MSSMSNQQSPRQGVNSTQNFSIQPQFTSNPNMFKNQLSKRNELSSKLMVNTQAQNLTQMNSLGSRLENINETSTNFISGVQSGNNTSRMIAQLDNLSPRQQIEDSFYQFTALNNANSNARNNLSMLSSQALMSTQQSLNSQRRKNKYRVGGGSQSRAQNGSKLLSGQNSPRTDNFHIDIEDITPEIAAQVVRNYLLPMFEKDARKANRERRSDEIQSPGKGKEKGSGADPNTVYGELKLSEKLSLEMVQLRKEKEQMAETIENLTINKQNLEKAQRNLEINFHKLKTKNKLYKSQIVHLQEQKRNFILQFERLETLNKEQQGLLLINETNRKVFSQKLQKAKVKNEKYQNMIIELKYQNSLQKMESDIMGDQLKRLYDAISFLGEGKKHADKKQIELDQIKKKFEDLLFEKDLNNSELQTTIVERDRFRGEVKEVSKSLKKMQEDKEKLVAVLKERMNQLDSELKNAESEAQKWQEEFSKVDKQVKALQNERDKMRQRIQKLKNRRNFNINQKICKQCGKEYLEKENFNWSCRTHRSEFGGEMWWCCGKTTKDAPGCKFSKHVCKEDEDEDIEQQEEADKELKNKYARCYCCKEKGHRAQDCPRDPNMKTAVDANEEDMRIVKAKDFRKLLSDSLHITSRFFKGLIKRSAGDNDFNPFSKGAMGFDDYSYKYYNNVVLNPKTIKAINDDENTSLIAAVVEAKQGVGDNDSILTADNIREFENSIHFDEEGLNDFVPGQQQDQQKKDQESFDEDKKKKKQDSDKESGDGSEQEEDDDQNKIEIEQKPKITRMIIEELKSMQEQDLFIDIQEIKNQASIANINNAKQTNLIDIKDYLRELQIKNMQKAHKQNKSMNKSGRNQSQADGSEEWHSQSFGDRNSQNKESAVGEAHPHGSSMDNPDQLQNQQLIEQVEKMFEGQANAKISVMSRQGARGSQQKDMTQLNMDKSVIISEGGGPSSARGENKLADISLLEADTSRQLLNPKKGKLPQGQTEQVKEQVKKIVKKNVLEEPKKSDNQLSAKLTDKKDAKQSIGGINSEERKEKERKNSKNEGSKQLKEPGMETLMQQIEEQFDQPKKKKKKKNVEVKKSIKQ